MKIIRNVLNGANRMIIRLIEANLQSANLVGADLEEANFLGANFEEANFGGGPTLRELISGQATSES